MFIAFGPPAFLVVQAVPEGAVPLGVLQLVSGLAFPPGLILVMVAGEGLLAAAALETGGQKTARGAGAGFASDILADMLVCLAVWMTFAVRSVTGISPVGHDRAGLPVRPGPRGLKGGAAPPAALSRCGPVRP